MRQQSAGLTRNTIQLEEYSAAPPEQPEEMEDGQGWREVAQDELTDIMREENWTQRTGSHAPRPGEQDANTWRFEQPVGWWCELPGWNPDGWWNVPLALRFRATLVIYVHVDIQRFEWFQLGPTEVIVWMWVP